MSDWHESEAKAECLDLRVRVRELEAERQWISVEDRPPSEDDRGLVMVAWEPDNGEDVDYGYALWEYQQPAYIGFDAVEWFFDTGVEKEPTHWRHVPRMDCDPHFNRTTNPPEGE